MLAAHRSYERASVSPPGRGLLRGRLSAQEKKTRPILSPSQGPPLSLSVSIFWGVYLFNLAAAFHGRAAQEPSHQIFKSCLRGLAYRKNNKFALILFENHQAMICSPFGCGWLAGLAGQPPHIHMNQSTVLLSYINKPANRTGC